MKSIYNQEYLLENQAMIRNVKNMIEKETNPEKRKIMKKCLEQFQVKRSKKDLQKLPDKYPEMLHIFMKEWKILVQTFYDVLKIKDDNGVEKFKQFEKFDVKNYLMNLQGQLSISDVYKGAGIRYTMAFTKQKKHLSLPFLREWTKISKIKFKEIKTITKEDNIQQKSRPRIQNNKVTMIEKYLDSRKDLHFSNINKMKQVAEVLAMKLDIFMKYSVEKVMDIAILKNKKKTTYLKNELAYFSFDQQRLFFKSFNQDKTKITALVYPNSLEKFSLLRNQQLLKQDELRNKIYEKIDNEKKIDKKIESYVFKERSKDFEMIEPYKDDQPIDGIERSKQSVVISIEHVIYFLQQHPLLQNSMLLMGAYYKQ